LLGPGPADPRDLLDAIPFVERTLTHLLHTRVPREAPYMTLEGEDRALSWADLAAVAEELAGKLAAAGVAPGDVVCQLGDNSLEHLAAVFAIARLGAIECPVNTGLKGASLSHVLTDADPRVVIADADQLGRLCDALDGLRVRPTVVVRGDSDGAASKSALRIVSEAELAPAPVPDTVVSPGDPATIMYTSGTTGVAKGVVLPHHFAFSAAAVKIGVWGLSASEVLFTSLPLFHSNARYSTFMTSALAGGRVAIMERFSASRFWDQVRRTGATEVATVGTVAPILLERPPSADDRDHSVRFMHGAGALPPERRSEFEERFGLRLVTGFAMTETSHFSTVSPLDPDRHAGSGRPVPGFEVAILNPSDEPLAEDGIGEIAVRPQIPYSMFLGYYKRPEATLAAWRNLWFHTGDLGYVDDRGLLHWVDRAKDAIRRKGEMISSHDVEAAALRFPGIAAAAAVGVPGELGEQEVKLVVQPAPDAAVPLPELHEHCRADLPDFAVPRFYEVVDELPKTSTHKVDKKLLTSTAGPQVWLAPTAAVRR
jgi:crotonobetaine/carnitine-CoA ligase